MTKKADKILRQVMESVQNTDESYLELIRLAGLESAPEKQKQLYAKAHELAKKANEDGETLVGEWIKEMGMDPS